MSSTTSTTTAVRSPSPINTKRSEPIGIPMGGRNGHHHARSRSDSASSESTEGTPPPMTPLNTFGARSISTVGAGAGPGTSPTSPIMTMLAGQTPLKSPTAYPFSKIPFSSAVDEEDYEVPTSRHSRRASMNAGNARFVPGTMNPAQQERGANVLRRLSLGGTFGRATVAPVQPPSPPRGREVRAVEPAMISLGPPVVAPPSPKRRRGATLGAPGSNGASSSPSRVRRAPSPMGERILKGHFDSFH